MNDQVAKWLWMMDFCRAHLINPRHSWAWEWAEREWENRNE